MLQDLFSTFTILSIEETTLGGNQWLKDMDRMKWEAETNDVLQSQATSTPVVEIGEGVTNVLLNQWKYERLLLKQHHETSNLNANDFFYIICNFNVVIFSVRLDAHIRPSIKRAM